MLAQRQNIVAAQLAESIPVVKWHVTIFSLKIDCKPKPVEYMHILINIIDWTSVNFIIMTQDL
jgi:hypothetical protein